MYWLYAYGIGAALKFLCLMMSSNNRPNGPTNFNEVVLWPVFLIWDAFMFFLSIFVDKD